MKEWIVPVEWSVCDTIKVKAENLEEAIEWAREHADEIPCGDDPYYIDGSWKIEFDDGQPASEIAELIRMYQN